VTSRAAPRGDRVGPAGRSLEQSPAPSVTFRQGPAAIVRLQRAAGNRAVARMLQRTVITDVLGGSVGDDFATALLQAVATP
jgi:hypothetical protein